MDTSVLVSAFRSDAGYSYQLTRLIGKGRFITLITPALFLEYESVLKRPEQRRVHGLSPDRVDAILANMQIHFRRIRIVRSTRGEALDAKDDLVLEAAVNGFASAIVTYNRRHLEPAARNYGIRILTPAELFTKGILT